MLLTATCERLESRRLITPDGCWTWTGAYYRSGYGAIRADGKMQRVHRLAYQLYIGEIPEGLEIDHLCRNKGCFNPEHLEAVSHQENVHRWVQKGTKPQEQPPIDTRNRHSGRVREIRECPGCGVETWRMNWGFCKICHQRLYRLARQVVAILTGMPYSPRRGNST